MGNGIKKNRPIERNVPCNGCVACCQNDMMYLHPEDGDDPAIYEGNTRECNGRTALKHKENGDCIYLDRDSGCTIHDKRPAVCRSMDCRIFAGLPKHEQNQLVLHGRVHASIFRMGRRKLRESAKTEASSHE